MNVDARLLDALPVRVGSVVAQLPGAKQVTDLVLAELGIPREMFAYLTYPTHFDSTKTQQALAGSGHRGAAAVAPTRRPSGSTGSATTARTAARTARWPAPSRAGR